MPSKRIADAVSKSTIQDERIKIAVNDRKLLGKIKTDIKNDYDKIFWYIRFNIVLDSSSISKKTMNVMETDGYILDTDISYDTQKNLIVINPVDEYEEDVYYILNITRKVRSARGNHLKRDIHILFKLKDKQISEYRVLDYTVRVPKPRRKPASLKKAAVSKPSVYKLYSFDPKKLEGLRRDQLPYDTPRVNVIIALIGIALAAAGFFLEMLLLLFAGAVVCVIGFFHITAQSSRRETRSVLSYNLGVFWFNAGKYSKAEKHLRRARLLDEKNEMAEYANDKITFYK